ncbi:ATP synthase subunit I [Gallaecimonas sp. GXIMD4217]|uniref:ATP synthase subunit I n=1 Tax=Gallaecimonas sp. GXIMD4217 TaxID=3131927 RepID=UPI00311B3049
MSDKLARPGRQVAYKLVAVQAAVVLIASCISAAVWGVQAGYSALLGGLICVLPNFVFARLAFAKAGARAAQQVVHGFYKGEALKIGLTVLLFVIVLLWVPVAMGALFATYGIGVMAQWFAPVLIQRK